MNEEYTRGLITAKGIILHSKNNKEALDKLLKAIDQSIIFDENYLK